MMENVLVDNDVDPVAVSTEDKSVNSYLKFENVVSMPARRRSSSQPRSVLKLYSLFHLAVTRRMMTRICMEV